MTTFQMTDASENLRSLATEYAIAFSHDGDLEAAGWAPTADGGARVDFVGDGRTVTEVFSASEIATGERA
jgi:hypothetical protein